MDKKNKKGIDWKYIALGIIFYLIIAFFLGFFPFNNIFIKNCIDDCIYEEWFCVEIESQYSQSGENYILFDDYEMCHSDLEICVSNCE